MHRKAIFEIYYIERDRANERSVGENEWEKKNVFVREWVIRVNVVAIAIEQATHTKNEWKDRKKQPQIYSKNHQFLWNELTRYVIFEILPSIDKSINWNNLWIVKGETSTGIIVQVVSVLVWYR